jgi:hypothetical protein
MTLHRDVEKRRGRRQAGRQAGRQRQWSRAQERDRQPLSAAAAQCSPWLASPVATHSGTHCRSPLFRVSPGRARRRGTGSLRSGKTSNHDRPTGIISCHDLRRARVVWSARRCAFVSGSSARHRAGGNGTCCCWAAASTLSSIAGRLVFVSGLACIQEGLCTITRKQKKPV